MLMNLLKFFGYGLATAVLLPLLLAIFAITATWSLFAFLTFLAIW